MFKGFSKKRKFSIFNSVSHELIRGYKEAINDGMDNPTASKALIEAEMFNIKELTKYAASFFTLVILINRLGQNGTITLPTFLNKIEVPVSYGLFVAFAFYTMLCFAAIKAIVFLSVKEIILGNIPTNSRFSNAKSVFDGDQTADLTTPFRNGQLLRIPKLDFYILLLVLVGLYACLLIPVIASIAVFMSDLSLALSDAPADPLELIILGCATIGTFFISTYAILFFVPFRSEKNTKYIRWLFLNPISRNEVLHPQVKHWLDR